MKYIISLQITSPFSEQKVCIPWEQGAAYTAWIYRILQVANPALADRIHQTPPISQEKTSIRNFSVSPLQFESGRASEQGYFPNAPFAALTVGTFDADIAEAIVSHVSTVPLQIGEVTLAALSILPVPDPAWDVFTTLSVDCFPIALRSYRDGHAHPVFPRNSDWVPLLVQNVTHKARQFRNTAINPDEVTITTAKDWQARYQRPYGFPVPAFRPRAGLVIVAPSVVYDVIYTLGFGVLNSGGLGVLTLDTVTRLAGLNDTTELEEGA